ncbi:hypothetical protein [Methanoplanus endosymbiosus]|uniref:DUF2226 domain-containing protein n=1 Tax=Methanoplanus endosymbiosus TaxID=33865 RepID=A0A9E7PRE3_9EURY|nr:hypothetical protein [Methanoplanus endosymbiosus]UUX93606.1 hypothetical protein L6E24_05670 [Methanoplanus endosymbiosus]
MQLPRGRFERFVRDVTIKEIVDELGKGNFSGCCSGIFGDTQGEIIFQNGEIVLAESMNNSGFNVIADFSARPDDPATVELSVYSESQIKLSKEFNSKFMVISEEKREVIKRDSPDKSRILKKERPESDKTLKTADKKRDDKIRSKSTPQPSDEDEIILKLNDSEIESITRDFRSNISDILKKVNLDHLIEIKK